MAPDSLDIKPENILLYTSGAYPRIVIADFGGAITYEEFLASIPANQQDGKRVYSKCGTNCYLPPEYLRNIQRGKGGGSGTTESIRGKREDRRRTLARGWFEEEVQIDIYSAGRELCYTPLLITE